MATVEHPTDTLITLTPGAAAKVRELLAEEPDGESLVLRVAIQGGGCSGFQYGLGFDSGAAEGDLELTLEGVPVVVEPRATCGERALLVRPDRYVAAVLGDAGTTALPLPRA